MKGVLSLTLALFCAVFAVACAPARAPLVPDAPPASAEHRGLLVRLKPASDARLELIVAIADLLEQDGAVVLAGGDTTEPDVEVRVSAVTTVDAAAPASEHLRTTVTFEVNADGDALDPISAEYASQDGAPDLETLAQMCLVLHESLTLSERASRLAKQVSLAR